jgi:hypothetical protein
VSGLRFFTGFALPVLLFGFAQGNEPKPPVPLRGDFYLERSQDEFGFRMHGIDERTHSGAKFYRLPQSNVEMYKRLRPDSVKIMLPYVLTEREYQGQEVIGPYQVEGNRVWFGNQYYDGEGERGVGAFGYFDMEARRYQLFRPKEIARWEVSALLVEPDAVWIGLDIFGEDISTAPGGMLHWDRKDQHVQRYELEFVISHMRRDTKDSSTLVLTTRGGYALFRDGQVSRFRVEKGADGKQTAVAIDKFPPPPSIQ